MANDPKPKTLDEQRKLDAARGPKDQAAPGTAGTGEAICPTCKGTGRLDGAECPDCGGSGRIVQAIGGA